MKKSIEYINKDGIKFDIHHIESALVLEEAENWGFRFKVTERTTGSSRNFLAIVKKKLCQTQELAEAFIDSDPLRYLKSVYLDNYKNGETPLVWPDLTLDWIVL